MSNLLFKRNTCNVDKEIELLDLFLHSEDFKNLEENKITDFDSIGIGYLCTNERLDLYHEEDLKDKRVLTVTASGDHALNAAFAGASDITSFDINRIAKYYSGLKIAMVKKYNLEDFLDKLNKIVLIDDYTLYNSTSKRNDFINNMNNIISEVHKYLDEDVILFWEKVVDIVKQTMQIEGLFISNYYISNNAWADKENFSKLKYNLSSCEIKFIDSNVNTVHEKTDEKFDTIYLSNIIGRICNKEKPRIIELLSYLGKILNNNGVIYDYDWYDYPFKSKKIAIIKQYKVDHFYIADDDAYVYKFIKRKKLFSK